MDRDTIFSVLIAEDEMPARELIVDFLLTHPELKLSGIAKNGKDALDLLTRHEYDLVFMDIHLPHFSGIEVLEQMKKVPHIIFTTADDTYALKAFEFGALDYLLKPFTLERFNQSIEKFLNLQRSEVQSSGTISETGFSFKEHGKHYILPYQDIIYLTSHGQNTIIHTRDHEYESHMLLKKIEKKLPNNIFLRIHKQYMVNIRYIAAVEYYIGGQYIAFLNDEDENSLPVGKKYAPLLKDRLRLD